MSIFFINLSIQQIWSGCATENTTVNKIDKVTIIAFVLVSTVTNYYKCSAFKVHRFLVLQLEVRRLNSRCWQGSISSRHLRRQSFPLPFSLAGDSLAFLGLWPPPPITQRTEVFDFIITSIPLILPLPSQKDSCDYSMDHPEDP